MADICCPTPIQGLALRLTRADECGAAVAPSVENSRIQTTAYVSLSFSPSIATGSEISVTRANGLLCVAHKSPDELKWLDFTMLVCGLPFPLLEMALSMSPLLDGLDIIGGVLPSRASSADADPKILEVWSLNKSSDACAPGSTTAPFVQHLFPLVSNFQIGGSLDFSADAGSQLTITGIVEASPGFDPPYDGEWSVADVAAIQAGGPYAYKCVDVLPETSDCAYVAVGSGS